VLGEYWTLRGGLPTEQEIDRLLFEQQWLRPHSLVPWSFLLIGSYEVSSPAPTTSQDHPNVGVFGGVWGDDETYRSFKLDKAHHLGAWEEYLQLYCFNRFAFEADLAEARSSASLPERTHLE